MSTLALAIVLAALVGLTSAHGMYYEIPYNQVCALCICCEIESTQRGLTELQRQLSAVPVVPHPRV